MNDTSEEKKEPLVLLKPQSQEAWFFVVLFALILTWEAFRG
jgi:hypothetical protein